MVSAIENCTVLELVAPVTVNLGVAWFSTWSAWALSACQSASPAAAFARIVDRTLGVSQILGWLAVPAPIEVPIVTVVEPVVLPIELLAVNVYVVVCEGLTVTLPLAATVPTPELIETTGAGLPVTLHVNVTLCPAVTTDGNAENEETTGADEPPDVVAETLGDWADRFACASADATAYE